ncbi:hypothetical protein SNE40_002632 [Patella caerulea]|uniref:Integrator complex subunit 2 n=1 Tax=Patella caerulea TaxID=87958 RepID=A0AAN8K8V3_PATCE
MFKTREPVKSKVFQSMQNVDIRGLSCCSETELRPVLPSLVRMALCAPLDMGDEWTQDRKEISKILSGLEIVNNIVTLLSIDFHALEQDVKKEQQLRSKIGGNQTDSVLISNLQHGLVLEFERSDPARRIRLLLSELLFVMSEIKDQKNPNYQKNCELFESEVYLEEVSDILSIAQAELPNLLPLPDIAEALLSLKNGSWLICQLLANSPESFKSVCVSLISHGERQDEETIGGRRRLHMLQMMAAMNPQETLNIRTLCVENCTMPGLAICLSLKMSTSESNTGLPTSDAVAFVSSLMLGEDHGTRTWFSQFVKAGQKRKGNPVSSMLHMLRQYLLDQLRFVTPPIGQSMDNGKVVYSVTLLRLYCALKGMATLKFSDEETKALLEVMTAKPPPTSAGAQLISVSLCMLIASPLLLAQGGLELEHEVVEWIKWLLTAESIFDKNMGSGKSFGEMLFLIALHFHSNQTAAIAELVCNTLGMKSPVKANALSRIRQIFTQEIFTEQVIASHAVSIPVTEGLNANMVGYLPIHIIFQLLKSRVFSKHKVPIKDWIYRQMCSSCLPLHPLLPPLIDSYVNSIIVKGIKTDNLNQPITEQEILEVFEAPPNRKDISGRQSPTIILSEKKDVGCQILVLYYLLLYEDTLLNNMKSLVLSQRKMSSYSESIMSIIPINYLVQEAQLKQQQCAGIFPALIKLLASHFPHLCLVEDWLSETLVSTNQIERIHTVTQIQTVTPESIQHAVFQLPGTPSLLILQLQELLALPPAKVLPFAQVIVGNLSTMLLETTPRRVVELVKRVWFKIHQISPRSLRLSTINNLQESNETAKPAPYTEHDVIVDPLVVLRCDERVFRCPPLLEIVLRTLDAYTHACRTYLSNHIQAYPVIENAVQSEHERRDLRNALIEAQESAMLQILLESCLPSQAERESAGKLSNIREIQCLVCQYLHQAFIADPNLAKLVHFQGYPAELIPLAVSGIPSMHICLDFIPELFAQPQTEKQIFGIQLLSQLCKQYALPKSLGVAKLAINIMFSLLTVLETEERIHFYLQTVPCLIDMCESFPPLCDDVTSLLTQIGRVCFSQLSVTSNLMLSESYIKLDTEDSLKSLESPEKKVKSVNSDMKRRYWQLFETVQRSFTLVTSKATISKEMY